MAKKNLRSTTQESSQLNAKLNDYSAITRISASAKALYLRTGSWPIYAAATGSALAMATGANASLITSGIAYGAFPSNISVNPGGPYTQLGLIPGLSIKIHALATGTAVHLQLQGSHENIFFSQFPASAKNFRLGSPLAQGLSPSSGVGHTENVQFSSGGNAYGNFLAGKPGFVGFSFLTAGHVNTDYGWIALEFTDNAGIPYYLKALAYGVDTNPGQTPGTLLAGEIDGGFIPEPSTLSLAILASGAAGVVALRRRRREKQAVVAS